MLIISAVVLLAQGAFIHELSLALSHRCDTASIRPHADVEPVAHILMMLKRCLHLVLHILRELFLLILGNRLIFLNHFGNAVLNLFVYHFLNFL